MNPYNQKPIKSIRTPLSGKQQRTGALSLPLKGLVLAVCMFMILVVYKMTRGIEASGATNRDENAAMNSMKKAQQEELQQFQKDLQNEGEEQAEENEFEREERRARAAREEARAEEERKWKVQGGVNRWEQSDTIPPWLKDYFKWHGEQRAKMNETNWRDFRYIILTCFHDQECGNVAHRLRPIPGHLRAAYDSNRIFMIHWDAPTRLEHFMEPLNHGGVDWIVPDYMMRPVRKVGQQTWMNVILEQSSHVDRIIVNSMFSDDSFAEYVYNDKLKEGEVPADRAFHDIWHVLFKPNFVLQERISESLRLVGLKEGEYAAAHIDYELVPETEEEKIELKEKVENALNCLSQLRPGGPFLVAAQTYDIARMSQQYCKTKGVEVHAKQIAHDTSKVPSDLFTSFTEIFFMANAHCVAYNRGGYGQLGYILGFDYNCRVKYSNPREKKCEWKDAPNRAES